MSHEVSTFVLHWPSLGVFWAVAELSLSLEPIAGFAPSFWAYFWLVSTQDKLGISSSTPS